MNKITKHMEFKSWINLQQPFYHGSFSSIPIGTILTPNSQNYEKNWATSLPYYDILEKLRPKHMIALKDAIFMCDNLDDIGMANHILMNLFGNI